VNDWGVLPKFAVGAAFAPISPLVNHITLFDELADSLGPCLAAKFTPRYFTQKKDFPPAVSMSR